MIKFSAQNVLNILDSDKIKNDYILYKTKEDFQNDNKSTYLRIIQEKKLTFEKLSNHINEISSFTLENYELLLVIIKNSNSFVFLNAKELIIHSI